MTTAVPGVPPAGTGLARTGTRLWSRLAVACIGFSLLVMVVVAAAGPSQAVVSMPRPAGGPPWWAALHPVAWLVTVAVWAAAAAGAAGVAAGLVAVRRGARPRARVLVVAALTVTAVLAVLPPAGSTDTLDYAVYGRMVAIGHDPYVMTPQQLRLLGDPVGAAAPVPWETKHSLYGPLATVEQATAAILGGSSAARIAFWLKVWNALAFAMVVLGLDRLLRADPAGRARAHLLWSLNPLLLWGLVAAGHVDGVAAAVSFLGLALVGPGLVGRGGAGRHPGVLAGLAAGALVGMATDIKITFVLFGVGAAFAARRSPRTLLAMGAGALAVLVPSYLWFGPPAIKVLFYRDGGATIDNFYQLFSRPFGLVLPPDLTMIVVPLLVATGWLLLRRLPAGPAGWPAVRPALALSLAWLLVWPYQRPWYDAMAFCLLALFPASRLDWPVLARLAAGTIYSMPGMPGPLPAVFFGLLPVEQRIVVPLIRLAALLAVIALCLTGAWHKRPRAGSPAGERPAGLAGRLTGVVAGRARWIGADLPAGLSPAGAGRGRWGDAPSGQPTGRADAGQAGQPDS